MHPRILCLCLAAVALTLPAAQAFACGGCFSPLVPNIAQTVVQDAERVLFVRDEVAKKSIVHVEVRYTGLAKDFGWVLPLPKVPAVSVGSRRVFNLLDGQLGRKYQAPVGPAENCQDPALGCSAFNYPPWQGTSDSGTFADAAPAPGGGGPKGVDIVASGSTGPYNYLVIKGTDAAVLQKWLSDNGYATPAKATPILQSHIANGDVFVAIKLANGQGIQAIRPVVLTMDDAEPCVPLRLTSIAAASELTVAVTVAGPGRAIIKNHLQVEVHPLRLAFTPGLYGLPKNYAQVVAGAIDEAGGHAFVTESSVSSVQFTPGTLLPKTAAAGLAGVANLDQLTGIAGWLFSIADEEIAEAVAAPLQLAKVAPGASPLVVLAYLSSCQQYWDMPGGPPACAIPGGPVLTHAQLQAIEVDGAAAVKAIQDQIVAPTELAMALVKAAPRVTRLVTRVSPEEMDRDPVFAFNPALPEVAPVVAGPKFNPVCPQGWSGGAQQWRLSIDGLGSWVLGQVGVVDSLFKAAPAASWKGLIDETGQPQAIAAADIPVVDAAIIGAKPGKPALPKDLVLKPVTPDWIPPPSDPLVTNVGPWYAPAYCVPKPCWKSGNPPPTGPCTEPPPDTGEANTADTTAPPVDATTAPNDAGTAPNDTATTASDASTAPNDANAVNLDADAANGPEGGPVPGIDAAGGWKEVAAPPETEATVSLDSAQADTAKASVKPPAAAAATDGCVAHRGVGTGGAWAGLVACAVALWWGRRRGRGLGC
ncbi:MAG: DUF2330 domain-containing protein [Deltaproteobacteria bacterium]|nr:DUF2330 domain-containing protein [Deltaproteobacteria bacterium]